MASSRCTIYIYFLKIKCWLLLKESSWNVLITSPRGKKSQGDEEILQQGLEQSLRNSSGLEVTITSYCLRKEGEWHARLETQKEEHVKNVVSDSFEEGTAVSGISLSFHFKLFFSATQ